MQPLLDGPRAALSEGLVRELLQSHRTIQIKYGADALDADFAVVADISGYVSPGSAITSSLNATINRTCSLNIDGDATSTGWSYLSGYVKPYMVFRDPDTEEEARFNLGVYTLTTPERSLTEDPPMLTFTGYDLNYLLRQPIGDSYEVPAGVDPAQAAADAIGVAIPGVEVLFEDSGETVEERLSWPFDAASPYTYWDVVDALLASIGYQPVWVDWEGRFRIEAYEDLLSTEVEWTFDALASDNIMAEETKQEIDVYSVPNWWRFVMEGLTSSPVEGSTMFTYEDDSSVNPGSVPNRGRTVRYIESVPAVSYDTLVSYAERVITDTLQPAEAFTVTVQPFPIVWHFDVVRFLSPALGKALPLAAGTRRRVVVTDWSLPLDGMSDMTMTWLTVTDQTAVLEKTVTEE